MVVRDGECLLDAVDLEGVAQDREGLGRLLLHLKQLTLRIRTRSHHLTITNTHPGSQSTLRTTEERQRKKQRNGKQRRLRTTADTQQR